jgi:GAF domain-containing protein
MAEVTLDLRHLPKPQAYAALVDHTNATLDAITDPIAAMATMSALIYHGFGLLWAGFYRVVEPDLLRVGPYQGTLGCLEIRFGRGVCGTAAARRETVIVPDVERFPGHIACDSRARSEIVVPVFDPAGGLIAVLDLDSDRPATFDEDDAQGLERLIARFARPES